MPAVDLSTGADDAAVMRTGLITQRTGWRSLPRTPKLLARYVLLPAVAVLAAGCADRSYAAPPDVDAWTVRLLVASAVAVVAWWVLGIATVLRQGDKTGDGAAVIDLLSQTFQLVIGSALMFTVVGQLADWSVRAVHQWGTVGDGLLVLSAAVTGLGGLRGVPVLVIVLFAFVYPRPEVLLLLALSAFAGQSIGFVLGLVGLLRAKS